MKILIFAAHGSRKQESNMEVKKFFDNVSELLKDSFDESYCSFLQFGNPGIEALLDEVLSGGNHEITIFPYFLFNGTHVTQDIPEIADKFREKFPDSSIEIISSLGDLEGFDKFIAYSIGKMD